MKLKLCFALLLCLSYIIASAAFIKEEPVNTPKCITNSSAIPSIQHEVASETFTVQKMNFFQRFIFNTFLKKKMLRAIAREDKLASQSLTFGIMSFSLIALGTAAGYAGLAVGGIVSIGFLSLISGIIAISTGKSALEKKTTYSKRARTGKTLGILTIVLCFLALIGLVGAAIALTSWHM